MAEQIQIRLYGNVPVKKNRWKRGKGGAIYFDQKNTQRDLDYLAVQIQPEVRHLKLVHPDVTYQFYLPKNTASQRPWTSDFDGKVTTLMDLLVKFGVFADDSFALHNGTKVVLPAKLIDGPVAEVVITIQPSCMNTENQCVIQQSLK